MMVGFGERQIVAVGCGKYYSQRRILFIVDKELIVPFQKVGNNYIKEERNEKFN